MKRRSKEFVGVSVCCSFEISKTWNRILFMKKLQFGYNILEQKNLKKGIIELDFLRCVNI